MDREYMIKQVTLAEANDIVLSREPRGLFYYRDYNRWVGIDNTTGNAWGEEFIDLEQCLAWLRRK